MASFKSNEVLNNINNILNFNNVSDIPTDINKNIQLTYDINPITTIVNNVDISTGLFQTATKTVWTTPKTTDFYLTQIIVSWGSVLAPNNMGNASITTTIGGISADIFAYSYVTPTNQFFSIPFSKAVKIDRNVQINWAETGFLGDMTVILFGYTYDNTVYNN